MLACKVAARVEVRTRSRFGIIQRQTHTPQQPQVHQGCSTASHGLVVTWDRKRTVVRGLGKDVVDGWLDLANLVSSSGNQTKTPYDDLAYSIGKDVYVDIAGWHLFLRDMMTAAPGLKLSQVLAAQLGSKVSKSSGIDEVEVENLLKKVPVSLGGGKLKVSVYEVMPSMCVRDLIKICSEWADRQ